MTQSKFYQYTPNYDHTNRTDQAGLAFIRYCVENYDEWKPGMAGLSSVTKPMHKYIAWEGHFGSKSFYFRICTYERWCREKGFDPGFITVFGSLVGDIAKYRRFLNKEMAIALRRGNQKYFRNLSNSVVQLDDYESRLEIITL